MPRPDKRPPHKEPLVELMELRQKRGVTQIELAEKLGITRLHVLAVEMGRRAPSMELALRWLVALAPEARLDMFGPLPLIEERLRLIKRLKQISPTFKAA